MTSFSRILMQLDCRQDLSLDQKKYSRDWWKRVEIIILPLLRLRIRRYIGISRRIFDESLIPGSTGHITPYNQENVTLCGLSCFESCPGDPDAPKIILFQTLCLLKQ